MKRLILAGAGHPKGRREKTSRSNEAMKERKKQQRVCSTPQDNQLRSVETAFKPTHSKVDPASPAGAWNAKRKVGASMVAGLRLCAIDLVVGRNGFERLENPQALWLAEKDIEKNHETKKGAGHQLPNSQDHYLGNAIRMHENGLCHIGSCCIGPVGIAKHRASKEVTHRRDAAITELMQ